MQHFMILKKKSFNLDFTIFLIVFIIHAVYYHQNRHNFVELQIQDHVPSQREIEFNSLGDKASYFRVLALELQFMGDTYGRSTPLKDYDYKLLYNWFRTLDSLDNISDYVPSLAAYYYSMTPKTADIQYLVNYLTEHSLHRIDQKWWWIYQASYLAFHKLGDKKQGIKIAEYLTTTKANIPIWIRQIPALYHEKIGDKEGAYIIIKSIMDNIDNISEKELNFMHFFIKERLKILEK